MTSSDKATEDILTCSVCLEIFKNPKYLPCLHTFCECCLQTYIASGFEKGNKDNIECPVCRTPVSVPNTTCTPEEWVKLLPVNFLISGLIENQKASRPEKLCMLCERFASKSVEKAVFICLQCSDTLCESCEKYHRYMKYTSEHEVKQLIEFSDETRMKCYSNKCLDHPDKIIELYCVDDKIPCCSLCIAIGHRKCENVQTIEEASKGIALSTVLQDVQKEVKAIVTDVETVITSRKNNLSLLENQYESELKKIEDTFDSLINRINTQERSRKAELLKTFNEKKDVLETTLISYENKRKTFENDQKILDISVSKASEPQILIELTKIRKQVEKYKKVIGHDVQKFRNFDLVLQNTDISAIVKHLEENCTVKCESKFTSLTLNNNGLRILKFNRFKSLGTNKSWWSVKSKVDAVSFRVSEAIMLYGFVSYGPKMATDSCAVKVEVKTDVILAAIETLLHTKTYENNLTELRLEAPVQISADKQYDVLFVMTSNAQCNYGEEGISEVECEGVVFNFQDSQHSTNGTNKTCGQIPGFLFTKL